MKISAVEVSGIAGWPNRGLTQLSPGLNAIYAAKNGGKSTACDFLAHALFGKPAVRLNVAGRGIAPDGAAYLDTRDGRRIRVRRFYDAQQILRLCAAACDDTAVDGNTMHRLVGGLSPKVLGPLCCLSFREPLDIRRLLASDFAHEIQTTFAVSSAPRNPRRLSELASRRDQLAKELEARLGVERRASSELEARWRESDRRLRDQQQQTTAVEQRLRAVEAALAETDTRLRYRRLELNVELQWQAPQPSDWEGPLNELDAQIARTRSILAELAQREANVRARATAIQSQDESKSVAPPDERQWLAIARQLAADLSGEVSRLARAAGSQQCVCNDAHPRLRPIAETIHRQLDALQSILEGHERIATAKTLESEAESLVRSQTELRRHLDRLLDHRQTAAARLAGRGEASRATSSFSAADAEQLEARRIELEQERFQLVEQLREHTSLVRQLRAQRELLDRERAALLSARSIEHIQRELASVQRKLESAADGQLVEAEPEAPARASDFLAQLTDGNLIRLVLVDGGRRAQVVNRAGQLLPVDSLSACERDQVYLSLCLALLAAAAQRGVWLPLVLDEPFERLDERGAAALATVLDEFCRQGHQVLVFTGQLAAVDRLAAVGALKHELTELREHVAQTAAPVRQVKVKRRTETRVRQVEKPKVSRTRRTRSKEIAPPALPAEPADPTHSDAA